LEIENQAFLAINDRKRIIETEQREASKLASKRDMGSISKPHVVVIPCPLQGHIKTMLKLAKLLHYKGLHITFVSTEFNHKRFLRSRGPHALDDLPGFHFRTIPDGLPPSDIDATQDIPSLCHAMNKNFLAPFKDLLLQLKNTISENNPPITCIVSDPFAPFSIKAGEEVGLPVVMYATMNACGYMGFKQLYALRKKGFTPIKGIFTYLFNYNWTSKQSGFITPLYNFFSILQLYSFLNITI